MDWAWNAKIPSSAVAIYTSYPEDMPMDKETCFIVLGHGGRRSVFGISYTPDEITIYSRSLFNGSWWGNWKLVCEK